MAFATSVFRDKSASLELSKFYLVWSCRSVLVETEEDPQHIQNPNGLSLPLHRDLPFSRHCEDPSVLHPVYHKSLGGLGIAGICYWSPASHTSLQQFFSHPSSLSIVLVWHRFLAVHCIRHTPYMALCRSGIAGVSVRRHQGGNIQHEHYISITWFWGKWRKKQS